MIVPFAKGQAKGQPAAQPQPSETDMLMALSVMHQQGRFNTAQNARPGSGDNNPPAKSASEFEAAVRKNGEVRMDPNYPPMKEFLKNLPPDIEYDPKNDAGPTLRLKKEALTS